MEEIVNPHDKFFKQVMTDKEVVKDFPTNYLPKEIRKIIDPDKIQIAKDSFVEPDMQETFSDILYEVELAKKPAFIYFLFEHKSYPYPKIIPLVFYHGRNKWNTGLKLSDIMQEIPYELKKYVPEFEYILLDLSEYEEEDIVGGVKLKIFVEIMKCIFLGNFPEKVKELLLLFDKFDKNTDLMEF